MPRRPDALLDTSAAVALVVADHDAHDATWDALHARELGLAGHAWSETFSVLTRLPGAARLGVSGGAVYDALVAAAAARHSLPLVSRDRRAVETYRAFGVEVELLD